MIYSMTAFARTSTQIDYGQVVWEIRTVNHRYLDISVRLPDLFREWEPLVREAINSRLHRGKVECQLRFTPGGNFSQSLTVNTPLVDTLLNACTEVENRMQASTALKATDILRWPDVLYASRIDVAPLKEPILAELDQAITQVLAMREREGNALETVISQRVQKMQVILDELAPKLPQFLQQYRDKLMQRFRELAIECDPERLEQEMLLLTQKSDVAEEIDRLQLHLKEITRLFKKGGILGRKLDFLMQELNREANTLSSKAIDATVTRAAVELKVLTEQMREQIQNVV